MDWIVLLCASGAIFFAFWAVRLRGRRIRVIIPASLLGLLSVYELYMIHWEKTVVAPIRIDLFLEIPLAVILWVWGLIAVFMSREASRPSSITS